MPRVTGGPPRLSAAPRRLPATPGPRRAESAARWRNSRRWWKLRAAILRRDGLVCQRTGIYCGGSYPAPDSPVAHHIVRPGESEALFFDPQNLQCVSKAWHDREGQAAEKTGQ